MSGIPRVKLQLTKSGFRSLGVKIYNDLPIEPIFPSQFLQDTCY